MGSTVTQIACGRRHLLCRVGERILACGYGARGQLGCPHMAFALVPTPVPFTPNDESPVSRELISLNCNGFINEFELRYIFRKVNQ